MCPELFTLPFINISIKSYGFMMVLGFLAALFLAQRLSRRFGEDPNHVGNFGVYALLAGVIGARLFHVFHNWSWFRANPREIIAIWSGGLEFLGGFIGALIVMIFYFRRKKLSVLKFLDILAPALMLGLAFGRIGCFLNGCCFGAPCDLPWAIRFPTLNTHTQATSGCQKSKIPQYSIPFDYQIRPDTQRRDTPLLTLPAGYYDGYTDGKGNWKHSIESVPSQQRNDFYHDPKPPGLLTEEQLEKLKDGTIRMNPIHPAQIYSSLNALLLCLLLYLTIIWYYKFRGQIFGQLLILYGISRFFLESVRNSSPPEFGGLTISQALSVIVVPAGIIMLLLLSRRASLRHNKDISDLE